MKLNQLTKSISIALVASSSVNAVEFVVTTTDDIGDGVPVEISNNVYEINTLRSAIQQADDEVAFPGPDTIRFDPNIFLQGKANIELDIVGDSFTFIATSNSAFGINTDISIDGPTDGALTLTAADLRHFQVNSGGQLTINRVTLDGGFAPNNSSGRGGAVYVRTGASFHIADSTISNNTANTGGGINNNSGSSVTVYKTTFLNNVTTGSGGNGTGGAIFTDGKVPMVIDQSNFFLNTSNYAGGAVFTSGNVIIQNSTIHNNSSKRYGGGIGGNNAGVLTLLNSTISSNTAETNGGGIALGTQPSKGINTIVNATIALNQSLSTSSQPGLLGSIDRGGDISLDSSGGGLFVSNYYETIELHNTLIVNNVETSERIPDDIAAAPSLDSSHNLFGVGDSVIGLSDGINGNQIGTLLNPIDARLSVLKNNGGLTLTHSLDRSSPAIDAGSDVEATQQNLSNDQRGAGFTRFVSTVDIGALEIDLIYTDSFEQPVDN